MSRRDGFELRPHIEPCEQALHVAVHLVGPEPELSGDRTVSGARHLERLRVQHIADQREVDGSASTTRTNGGRSIRPAHEEYGCQEFVLTDPDGHVLAFGRCG